MTIKTTFSVLKEIVSDNLLMRAQWHWSEYAHPLLEACVAAGALQQVEATQTFVSRMLKIEKDRPPRRRAQGSKLDSYVAPWVHDMVP